MYPVGWNEVDDHEDQCHNENYSREQSILQTRTQYVLFATTIAIGVFRASDYRKHKQNRALELAPQ